MHCCPRTNWLAKTRPWPGPGWWLRTFPSQCFARSARRSVCVLRSLQSFACPECGTPTMNIVQGKELEVFALEVEE